MPGRFFLTTPLEALAEGFDATCDLVDPGPRPDAAPGEDVAVLIAGPRRMMQMRWGIIMSGRRNARGRPVMETIVNARSETLFDKSAFEGVQRCVLPVNGWYEWTGEKRRKTRWRIFAKDHPVLLFAAIYDIWKGPGGVNVPQLATVTCAPNSDLKDIHHRMPALLFEDALDDWLRGTEEAAQAVLQTAPDGLLTIEQAKSMPG